MCQLDLFSLLDPTPEVPRKAEPQARVSPIPTPYPCAFDGCTGRYCLVTDSSDLPGSRWECDKVPGHWVGIYSDGTIFFKVPEGVAYAWQRSIDGWQAYRAEVKARTQALLGSVGRK